MNTKSRILSIVATIFLAMGMVGQVPNVLNFQGRLVVGNSVFDGTGQFKFALVSQDGLQTYWLNSTDADENGEPDGAVTVPVQRGLYSVPLGDTSLTNMDGLTPTVFENGDAYLRVWFSDGVDPFQQLSPDQRVSAVGYALMAADVAGLDAARITSGVLPEQRLPSFMANVTLVSDQPDDPNLTAQGFVSFMRVRSDGWETSAGVNEPSPRFGHSAIWTGESMLVWGGSFSVGSYTGAGSAYRPEFDEWTTLSPVNAPSARSGHTSVWTGDEMIVWGGASNLGYLNTGGRYDLDVSLWHTVTTADAPSERSGHVAVWTGEKMIVWGGRNGGGLLDDGGVYDPAADQWIPLTLPDPPAARIDATAVWAGDRLIIWGGTGVSGFLSSGAQLTFDSNGDPEAWAPVNVTDAPSGRTGHSAVWAGDQMIVWGGQGVSGLLDDGVSYDPVGDAWTPLASDGAPTARRDHGSIWMDPQQNAVLIQGGETAAGATASGAVYDLDDQTWRSLSLAGDPVPRSESSMVWTGNDLILFGGKANGVATGGAQRLNPQPDWYFYRKP